MTQKRLLIVDGHSSYVNMAFVDWADQHGIILLILPPHTTHRLQPLDVGLFQPLATAYSWELDKMMNESGGHVGMTKSFFWPKFKRSWDKAFTKSNIQSAFRKSGIWPTNGSYIIKTITRPKLVVPEKTTGLCSPKSAKSIRRFYATYDKEPTIDKIKTIFSTTLHLAAQVSVLKHENRGLYNAIELQKKKGRQGIRLNLAGEANKGLIDCYSPRKVVKAREYQQEKERLRIEEEEAKLQRKIQRAANALKNKQDKAKRAAEREAKAAQKQLVEDLESVNKPAKKAPKKKPVSTTAKVKKATPVVSTKRKVPIRARRPTKVVVQQEVVAPIGGVVASGVVQAKRSTCTITLLQRFR